MLKTAPAQCGACLRAVRQNEASLVVVLGNLTWYSRVYRGTARSTRMDKDIPRRAGKGADGSACRRDGTSVLKAQDDDGPAAGGAIAPNDRVLVLEIGPETPLRPGHMD